MSRISYASHGVGVMEVSECQGEKYKYTPASTVYLAFFSPISSPSTPFMPISQYLNQSSALTTMTSQSSPTVTIVAEPPYSVPLDSAITPTVKAKLQFSSDSYLQSQIGSIYATAVVKDMNGTAIANSDYGGKVETKYQSKQTVGDTTNVTYAFSDLCVYKAGTFRITVSISFMDGLGSVVLCQTESLTFKCTERAR